MTVIQGIVGKHVLIVVNNWGVEETELTRPLNDLKAAGARVIVAAPTTDTASTVRHDRYQGTAVKPDITLDQADPDDYDLLVVPGGTCNVDRLRVNPVATGIAREFADAGKPIAAICHGPWLLVNADLLSGKTLTSCRYITADVENAGGTHRDESVVVDKARGWTLITSRNPGDLDDFVNAIEQTLAA